MTDEASGGGPGSRAAAPLPEAAASPGRGDDGDTLELGAFAADPQRDMREILSSIRRLMRDPFDGAASAPWREDEPAGAEMDASADPQRAAAERRRALARRFETVSPPPRAPVDEWPDDPEIDVDALADELLRGAQALSDGYGGPRVGADVSGADVSGADVSGAGVDGAGLPGGGGLGVLGGEATPAKGDAWGELEALLTVAQEALDGVQLTARAERQKAEHSGSRDAIAAPPPTAAAQDPGDDLVAFPTEALPDAASVLEAAQPYTPDTPDTSQSAAKADVSDGSGVDASDGEEALVPAPPPLSVETTPAPAAASADEGGAAKETVEVAEVVSVAAEAETPQRRAEPGQSAIPDDPRNAPGAAAIRTLAEIGAMVRDAAQRNHEEGSGTYQGAAPHPGIARLIGWREPTAGENAGAEPSAPARPGPKELALQALETTDGESTVSEPPLAPAAPAHEGATESLRPLLAGWLEENLPQLLENLVREEMARLAQKPKDE